MVSLCAAFLVLWILAFFLGNILPIWLTMTIGVLMVVTVITPMLAFAFGPASLLARFPATLRPLAQGHSLTLVIWLVGFGFLSIVRRTLPERVAENLLVVILIVGFVPAVLSLFGYGRLGRKLTEAVKQEERESWK